MSFSDEELERYARHIVLREVGGTGQRKLSAATVAVVGAGGLGSPALMYLAAAGVGRLRVIDDDTVSLSNLQRQVLHRTEAVGRKKTASAGETLQTINPHVVVEEMDLRLGEDNVGDLLAGADVVLDGSDSFATRSLVNRACVEASQPLVSAAMSQWEGQISLFDPARGGPCYTCIFPTPPAPGQAPSCAEAGIMGALAGVMGSMMAGETIKWIVGAGQPLRGEMLIYDALWGETRKIGLKRREGCAVCGG
ncbi:HesA/MoeB/ThiF family protein [Algicella marina]|uniref:Molybdopterin-synthase adenylyltransferase n=1 Tax=Algicella marina TaxID=2683284 RepID=A0A6P1T2D4_9RHOB|nr:molybdopterin-synthase adenylyltransferase MoeB [Algicella marina]